MYHLPVLSRPDFGLIRMPGPGLGNLLFPIARALIGQQELGGTFVMPTLRQIKVGPILRRERDKRTYGDVFRHRDWREMRHWLNAHLARKVDEDSPLPFGRLTRCYKGLGRQFHDLSGHSAMVRRFLEQHSQMPVSSDRFDVAIHVRLGDFTAPVADAAHQNARIPLAWYSDAVALALETLGRKHVRGVLFTDEDPRRVIEELRLTGFLPEPRGNALTSILALGRTDILIGSRSSFSLWGRYLGAKAAIWPAGFDLAHCAPVEAGRDTFL